MEEIVIYPAGISPALTAAVRYLKEKGLTIADAPDKSVTHLLLPVPSFESGGHLKGGGDLQALLGQLPNKIAVFGGNLDTPLLAGYQTADFLKDEQYLSENAVITADCAIHIARSALPRVWKHTPVLIIGWGRIGKHLAGLLQKAGADVTVAARKTADRAMLRSLGYRAIAPNALEDTLGQFRVLFNTAPAPVISEAQAPRFRADSIRIDLASIKGIAGSDVIWARGLPGKDAPEASGELIAETFIRLAAGKET